MPERDSTAYKMRRSIWTPVQSKPTLPDKFECPKLTFYSAVRAAYRLLADGSPAVDAVEIAIRVMEDNEVCNAGFGSNCTRDGIVEGDASIVDHFGQSGACAAVPSKSYRT